MANSLYGYKGGGGAAASTSSSLTGSYLLEKTLKRYLEGFPDSDPSSKYKPSSSYSMYLPHYTNESLRYSTYASDRATWTPPPGVDVAEPLLSAALKRSSEVLYPTVLGAHNTIGQTEAWYSTNSLAKRSRFEIASDFYLYPQRPGEKDCAHYMLTRTCKFGDTCKFDHPIWVPEGGIPNWKEIPLAATTEPLPERPGDPDCPYFLKTQRCKYGSKCKFNHPKDSLASGGTQSNDDFSLPERPSEPLCAFYAKTGRCKFGATCKFHHPKDLQIASGQENGNTMQNESAVMTDGTTGDVNAMKSLVSFDQALFHNSKGLPIRAGEVDCPFYLKMGSCKYGATCRYNHPDRNAVNQFVASPAANLNVGIVNPAASIYQAIDPRFVQPMLGVGPTIYPQRPGHSECDYYMKTGVCKFGERCRFHHPIDRLTPQQAKLTLAGFPRREGGVHCPYYMKTGTCKYGATCKFDHPPPGEVMAVASSQGAEAGIVQVL
ncbi:zinc finger CCCH domain-containing protein 37 isoform X2 [Mercurialis annua]|uniref:zinc finger CCCH domain-containing protein 37 isoform X2 n=1 Tax=Mercurialis annua TaxID=3986 RepID=UPI0021608636|nr:zinc finger CCCH domain-containing protein 37 isoform X2 [Mercurialis annua]